MENEKAELEKLIQSSKLDDYVKGISEFDNKILATLIENNIFSSRSCRFSY